MLILRLQDADSVMRFYVNSSTNVNIQMKNDGITLGRLVSCTAGLKPNFIDTYTDTDLILRRNGLEYIRLQGSDSTVRMKYSLVSTNTYVATHRPTAFGFDTFYYGNNSADNAYLEDFRFNHANESYDFQCSNYSYRISNNRKHNRYYCIRREA